ncbi:transposase [Ammoniphilus sp. YIM 78166]|uniref:REP-associated tyrosine transposase n=1 Tax=Ammoniphilus sp. YIM 78166 TaxID=1644106 RepID=UPI0010702143|nr:transposase [Ammoniphilus sp. YIM 78166]
MGRNRRVWQPGVAYHVTFRGNQRANLYRDDHDYEVFLQLLNLTNNKYPYNLYAFCLMPNHYHLLLSTDDTSLSKVMARINKGFANYFNTRYGVTGHVFEKRFYSNPVTEGYGLAYVSRYIHNNPVTANLTTDPAHYPWSSYPQYLSAEERKNSICPVKIARILSAYKGKAVEKRQQYQRFMESTIFGG